MNRSDSSSVLATLALSLAACVGPESDPARSRDVDAIDAGAAVPATADAAPPGDAGAPSGTEDPTGNPILLGPPKTIRSFAPAGAEPLFLDGAQWDAAKNALFVSLPFAANLAGGKGILSSFEADGTNYTERRAGDGRLTGVVGNSIDRDGKLISAELKAVTRTDPVTGAVTILATTYVDDGPDPGLARPLDGPNDLVALDDGTIYFTDPGYGVVPRPVIGHLFRLAVGAPAAVVVAAYDDNPSPNGIALSSDQKALYVGFTAPAPGTLPYVRRYVVAADRSLVDAGKFLEVPSDSAPDGLAVDSKDNLFVALKTGIAVYRTDAGAPQPYGGAAAAIPQTVLAGEPTSLTFGGADRKRLYVTTKSGKALEYRVAVAGLLQ